MIDISKALYFSLRGGSRNIYCPVNSQSTAEKMY